MTRRIVHNVSGLRPVEVPVLEALISGANLTEAAEAGGITDRTLRRWLAEGTPFRQALDRARQDQADAVESLRQLARGEKAISTARLKAAMLLAGIVEQDLVGPRDQFAKPETAKGLRKLLVGPRLPDR